MDYQLLKNVERESQNYPFSPLEIKNWSLPSWFVRQSHPLSPGYILGGRKFANLCYRNWTMLCNESGEDVLAIDREGTILIPKKGISIEVWVNNGKTFFIPGQFIRTEQEAVPEFPCIETRGFFQNGYYESRTFPAYDQNEFFGIEFQIYANGEEAFNEFQLLLVIRPYDYNGLTAINRLEYKNRSVRVNNEELCQFETEPKIIFCTKASMGDVTEYYKLERNREEVSSVSGNCTGAIGYAIRPIDLQLIKLCFNTRSHQLFFSKRIGFPKNWLSESKQRWISRSSYQHRMISTNSKMDIIYHNNLNYLKMFSGTLLERCDVYRILVLNRFALYSTSRAYLLKTLKKVGWDGSLSSTNRLTSEKLVFALFDYFLFSGDRKIVKDNWPIIKRISFWLIQNRKPITSNLSPESCQDLGWICAAFKSLAKLAEVIGSIEDFQLFYLHFQELWSQILGAFSRKIKDNVRVISGKGLAISGAIASLSLSFPLRLYPRNERFVRNWLNRIVESSAYNGGVISPMEFQGVDLELTARLGSILLREEEQYDSVLKFLTEAVSPTGTLPDRIHPISGCGIGNSGHDPDVCCQFLLLLRNLMIMEEEEILFLLPGILSSSNWQCPQIDLRYIPTSFGEISLRCQTVGNIVQIEFSANFRIKPQIIGLILKPGDCLVYTDSLIRQGEKHIELGSDFKIARIRRGT